MVDVMVKKAQQWVNATYGAVTGYVACPEDGKTGWPTIESLTMGLQHELGISPVVDEFGPATYAALQAHGTITPSETNLNIVKIVQSALYCKGYKGGAIDGDYDGNTQEGVLALQIDATGNAPTVNSNVSPKLFKALLTMDAFVLIGDDEYGVRPYQQWLNRTYLHRENFFYVPCDGLPSRGIATATLYAVQYEIGMSDAVANGNFGPGTRAGLKLPAAKLLVGTTDGAHNYVKIFQGAMRLAERNVDFNGSFTSATSADTRRFQVFAGFTGADQTGIGDYRTWAELLVSTGDIDRPATGCDVSDDGIISQARANVLTANGMQVIGRYLAGTTKIIQPGELDLILSNGVNVFPIMQEANDAPSEFGYSEGLRQGEKAHDRATQFGFPYGTTIYFAVDYDPQDDEIEDLIITFFNGVRDGIQNKGSKYAVGVYGSRNVCIQVSDRGLAVSSFVGGMSSGYSGNMGFPLPANWSFNQIEETTIASGTEILHVDRDVVSGRDLGVSSLTTPPEPNTQAFAYFDWLYGKAVAFKIAYPLVGDTASNLVLQYMRAFHYDGVSWLPVAGAVNAQFVTYVREQQLVDGMYERVAYRDPATQSQVGTPHWAASLQAVTYHGIPDLTDINLADFGGWAGDLITVLASLVDSGIATADAYAWARERIGADPSIPLDPASTYSREDYLQDVDAMNIGLQLRATPSLNVVTLLKNVVSRTGTYGSRYGAFNAARVVPSGHTPHQLALKVFTTSTQPYQTFRHNLFFQESGGHELLNVPPLTIDAVARAWADDFSDRYANE